MVLDHSAAKEPIYTRGVLNLRGTIVRFMTSAHGWQGLTEATENHVVVIA
jgi:hypothetical protein